MWNCPKCDEALDDGFDVCWQCGTNADGIEDVDFVVADDAEAIFDPVEDQDIKPLPDLDDEFGDQVSAIVECYRADSITEAHFIADQIRQIGIPATSDNSDLNIAVLGGWKPQAWNQGPRVRVRPEDLTRARVWIEDYKAKRKARRERPEIEETDDD